MQKNSWVIASNNSGKISELNNLLLNFNISLIPQSTLDISEAEEPASTFIENSIVKARHATTLAKLPAIADDSGLIVPCLDGAPGIKSARYAGSNNSTDNIDKLLSELKKLAPDQTTFTAYFYCVIVVMQHELDPCPLVCEGRWDGEIILEKKGDNGFGYDSVFYDSSLGLTAAQMTKEQKQAHSHRGQAIAQLKTKLGTF